MVNGAPKKPTAYIVGKTKTINMPVYSEPDIDGWQTKHFQAAPDDQIAFFGGGELRCALRDPKFTISSKTSSKEIKYTLEYKIYNISGDQSHRGVLDQTPAVLRLWLFDKDWETLLYMGRYAIFEFWCGQIEVMRWEPNAEETDQMLIESHADWRPKVKEVFDRIAFVRVGFHEDQLPFKDCPLWA